MSYGSVVFLPRYIVHSDKGLGIADPVSLLRLYLNISPHQRLLHNSPQYLFQQDLALLPKLDTTF
jgi:hypothetical protein